MHKKLYPLFTNLMLRVLSFIYILLQNNAFTRLMALPVMLFVILQSPESQH